VVIVKGRRGLVNLISTKKISCVFYVDTDLDNEDIMDKWNDYAKARKAEQQATPL
jgi:hypothetical protein